MLNRDEFRLGMIFGRLGSSVAPNIVLVLIGLMCLMQLSRADDAYATTRRRTSRRRTPVTNNSSDAAKVKAAKDAADETIQDQDLTALAYQMRRRRRSTKK